MEAALEPDPNSYHTDDDDTRPETNEWEKYPQGVSKSYWQPASISAADSVSAYEMEHLHKLPESM